nr:outer membrane lipoprotein-sorting protein [Desulfobacula sp.]
MNKSIFLLLTAVLISCLVAPTPAGATEALTGEAIARQVFDRDRGKNSISTAVMILENEKGDKRSRTFTNKRILEGGLEKQLIRFTDPADINGTGFLTIEKPGYETEQFLYLPALRRSRRIVSSQKFHQFVNSDFTYEDMERHPVENYFYEIKGEKQIDGKDCYILETRAKKGIESQYSSITAYIVKQSFVTLFAEYYDRKGQHIKTYRVLGLEQKQNIWTETKIMMEDVAARHKTHIELEHIEYNTDITNDQISNAALEKF